MRTLLCRHGGCETDTDVASANTNLQLDAKRVTYHASVGLSDAPGQQPTSAASFRSARFIRMDAGAEHY